MNTAQLFSNNDARMYTEGCIFTHNGLPVRVERATTKKAVVQPLLGGEPTEVKMAELNVIGSVGNVMFDGRYSYTTRMPRRQARWSLNQSSLKVSRMPWDGGEIRVNSPEVGNAIINKYPSLNDALTKVFSGECVAVPFHKDWGIGLYNNIPHLFFQDTPVGVAYEGFIKLFSSHFFLKERLMEVLNELV